MQVEANRREVHKNMTADKCTSLKHRSTSWKNFHTVLQHCWSSIMKVILPVKSRSNHYKHSPIIPKSSLWENYRTEDRSDKTMKIVKYNVESFASMKVHGSCWSLFHVAISRTSTKATTPRIQVQCITWYACLLPSFHRYSITDHWDRDSMSNWCWYTTTAGLIWTCDLAFASLVFLVGPL